jgi:hypothetical protein
MTEEIRKLLKDLRHDLVTMNGMGAFDQAAPHITFTVDNRELIKRINAALGDRTAAEPHEFNYGSESQYLGDPEDWKKHHKEEDDGSAS